METDAQMGYRLDYWQDSAKQVLEAYGDPEHGHGEEDRLLEEFVAAVAAGHVSDPQAAAKALSAGLLKHERTKWYA